MPIPCNSSLLLSKQFRATEVFPQENFVFPTYVHAYGITSFYFLPSLSPRIKTVHSIYFNKIQLLNYDKNVLCKFSHAIFCEKNKICATHSASHSLDSKEGRKNTEFDDAKYINKATE